MTHRLADLGVDGDASGRPPKGPGTLGLARRVGFIGVLTVAVVIDFVAVRSGELRFGGDLPVGILVLVAAPFFLVLAARNRRPRLVFVVVLGYSVTSAVLVPGYTPFSAVLVMLFTMAARLPRSRAIGWLAAVTPLVLVNTANIGWQSSPPVRDYVLAAFIWIVIFATAWLAGRSTYRHARHAELRESAARATAELQMQDERLRLAREIHDIVSHTIGAMTFLAAGTRASTTSAPPVEAALQAIETSGSRAMWELDCLLGLLRSRTDDPDGSTISLADLEDLLVTTRSCGVSVDVSVLGSPVVLSPTVDHAAYRIIGECLTNVVKHSRGSGWAHVHLDWQRDVLEIIVRSSLRPSPIIAAGAIRPGSPGYLRAGGGLVWLDGVRA